MIVSGQTAVITGGASGIGLSVSKGFAARGVNVVIADVDGRAAELAADAIHSGGGRSVGLACDVRDEAMLQVVREAARGEFGSVDLLVNNVGAPCLGPVEQVSLADWAWLFDLNVMGMVRGLRVFLPDMLEAGAGRVVFTASSLALLAGHPFAGLAVPYITSKGAIVALAQSVHQYLAPHGIGVTLLAPDHTDTNFPMSGRLTGTPDLTADANPYPAQTPEQVTQVLFDALDNGDFLASATPNCEELLALQSATKFDPGALTSRYYEGTRQSS